VRCDGATLDEARARAREMCGTRTVVREVVVAAGGQFTVKLAAESERGLREREQRTLPAGAVVKDRRLVHPKYEVLHEAASSEDELLANLRRVHPQHRVVSVACQRQPSTGVFGMGKHLGEYEVTVIDTQLRSEVSYETRSCVEVVVLATLTDCLEILHQPSSPDAPGRRLAAARCLAEQAQPSHGDGILDALEKLGRDEDADRDGGRDIHQVLISALERIATPPLIPRLLARWAPRLAEWQAALLSRLARSAPGFEALAACLRSPEAHVCAAARDLLQRLENVPVPPSARKHMQDYEKQRADEVRAWLDAHHPGIARDRFCLDLLGKLAERPMRITGDRDELADWCRDRGLGREDGETLANVLVAAGLAVGPWQDSADRPTHTFYGITDNGRSFSGASLFAR